MLFISAWYTQCNNIFSVNLDILYHPMFRQELQFDIFQFNIYSNRDRADDQFLIFDQSSIIDTFQPA